MAYVESFTWDIFLSYAHNDNVPYETLPRGWVTAFQEVLDKVMLEKAGRKVSIFWDQGMRRNEDFSESIAAAINGSALFVALLSNSYRNSEACATEVETFCKKIQDEPEGPSLGSDSRFFNVLRYNIPPAQWLAPLQGKNSYGMFQNSINGSLGQPLHVDQLADEIQKLLADQLYDVLNKMRATRRPATTVLPANKPSQRFSVFVADVDEEWTFNRNELIDALQDPKNGEIDVFGSTNVSESIAKSQVSIHILGGTPNALADEQLRLGKSAPWQVIWLSQQVAIPKTQRTPYQQLLLDLLYHNGHSNPYEFILGEDSTSEIVDAVKSRRESWLQQNGANDLYLDIRKSDWQGARQLRDYLEEELKKQQIKLSYPYYDPQDPGRDDFDKKVMRAKAVVLFYGAIEEEIVKQRLAALNELTQRPVINVYAARPVPPEKKPDNITAMMPQVKWIDNTERFNAADLNDLLNLFRPGRPQTVTA
jgi:hypothetical protein